MVHSPVGRNPFFSRLGTSDERSWFLFTCMSVIAESAGHINPIHT